MNLFIYFYTDMEDYSHRSIRSMARCIDSSMYNSLLFPAWANVFWTLDGDYWTGNNRVHRELFMFSFRCEIIYFNSTCYSARNLH